MATSQESELVTVRVPVGLLEALRLACQATGRSMSSEIRQGIQMRMDELREDPEVKQKIQERISQMQSLYGLMDADPPAPSPVVSAKKEKSSRQR